MLAIRVDRGHDGNVSKLVHPNSMIFTYRRASTEVNGSVRASAIEVLSLEQMEGGQFHMVARLPSGLDVLISELLPNIHHARLMLEGVTRWISARPPSVRAR